VVRILRAAELFGECWARVVVGGEHTSRNRKGRNPGLAYAPEK
jgi:hypothetical protein